MQSYSDEMDKSDADKLTLQNQRGVNALQALTNQTTKQGIDDDQAVRQATIASGGDTNALLKALNAGGQYKASQALQKTLLDNQKTKSDIGLADAHAGNFTQTTEDNKFKLRIEKSDKALKDIAGFGSPAEAAASLQAHITAGDVNPAQGDMIMKSIPQDPTQFASWQVGMLRKIMSATDQIKSADENSRAAATVGATTRGQDITASTALAGQQSVAGTALAGQKSVAATALAGQRSVAANAAGVQAGENTRAGLLRSNQLLINGLDGQGNILGGGPGGSSFDGLVKGIGTGQVPQATALARMPAGMKAQVLTKLAEQYPDYDPTDMAQRSRAAVAFGTGPQGNSVRSFNVSLSHLDTLSNLADALHNGNMQLVNKVGNIFTQQTGSPAPTNFEAAKKIVTDEIVKAIVGTGGGVHDREAAAETIGKASSPAQLAGVIKTYKELMVGQLGGLERQYQSTTGRTDFKTKFMSPEAKAVQHGGAPDIHSEADAILGRK